MNRKNVSFILVEPKDPGNIGSSARAIKNMGFNDLRLVRPTGFPSMTAFALAHGAEDVLASARVCTSVKDAIKDTALVFGTTRRLSKLRGISVSLKEGAQIISNYSDNNCVAILFGREDKGLSNEELLSCAYIVTIPTSEGQPSINLSHAVLIIAYELFISRNNNNPESDSPMPSGLASQSELSALYDHIQRALKLLDFGARGSEDLRSSILRNMGRIVGRFGLFAWEVNMLHGVCSQIEKKLKEC